MMAAAPSGLFAHKSKRINAIQRQLASDFQPAFKNVAVAGHNLLRAYQNLSRQHYVYTASLYALAFSSSTAEPDVQEKAKELEKITEVLKAIQGEHNKWVEYFAQMTATINHNSETEKERVKALQNGFLKREKEMNKAVDRGRTNPKELEKFYEKELAEMRDQQAQRYRFFVEKNLELMRNLAEWTKFSTNLMETELGLREENEGKKGEEEEEDGHLKRTENAGIIMRNGPKQAKEEVPINITKEQQNQRRKSIPPPNQQSRRESQSQIHLEGRRLSMLPSVAESNGPPPQSIILRNGQQQQQQQPQSLFRPIPILPSNQQKHRHSLALTQAIGHSNGELMSQWERQQMATLPTEHHQQRQQQQMMMQSVVQQLHQFYNMEGPQLGGRNNANRNAGATEQLDRIGLNQPQAAAGKIVGQNIHNPQMNHKNNTNGAMPLVQPPHFRHYLPPPVVPPPLKPISPLVTGNASNSNNSAAAAVVPNSNSYYSTFASPSNPNNHHNNHSRGYSQESTASSGMIGRFTPPIFSASDYGRLMECRTPYEAQGENQLSLSAGERIFLVKSGTRGWILGKTELEDRHGWFPAKYLKLIE